MIKGLEALIRISHAPVFMNKTNAIVQLRNFADYSDDLCVIEKELKTLEVISRYFYSKHIIHDLYCLGATDEEIALAREVLKE